VNNNIFHFFFYKLISDGFNSFDGDKIINRNHFRLALAFFILRENDFGRGIVCHNNSFHE